MTEAGDLRCDVVVIGGGAAGIAAAWAAAKSGAKTVLIESGPMVGGDMTSGLPFDGCLSGRGEWIVGGFAREMFDACEKRGGCIGAFPDRRALWMVAADPEAVKLAVVAMLDDAGVDLRLYTFAQGVEMDGERIAALLTTSKSGPMRVRAQVYIDATGDGDIAAWAGAPFEKGAEDGTMQPVSMVFRMIGVEPKPLLDFVCDHPENTSLGENPLMGPTPEACAEALRERGLPKMFLKGDGPLLSQAIADGEMYACSMLAVHPIAMGRKEVSVNSTRLGGIDATQPDQLSHSLAELFRQVETCAAFLRRRVPGFEAAELSGIAPRIGVRETRRIMGDYVLSDEDVLESRKSDLGVAKGGHEYDIHCAGKGHVRHQLKDGGSYDIPYGCLTPRGLSNVLVAGRCLSATRGAHSTARVMGTCMATGHATGSAAAICAREGFGNVREVDVQALRQTLREQGAILEGTR